MNFNWNHIMGIISTAALFLPIALILVLRMGRYRTFPVLIAYYIFAFANNVVEEGYIAAGNNTVKYWGLANNLLDVPLMLFFLIYFCTSALQAKRMKAIILGFVLFFIFVFTFLSRTKKKQLPIKKLQGRLLFLRHNFLLMVVLLFFISCTTFLKPMLLIKK